MFVIFGKKSQLMPTFLAICIFKLDELSMIGTGRVS
jgi:hypothetical protein